MASRALPPGRTGRRALFGALDADGWSWAFLKAFIWFIFIILFLGYVPDRAYYFTVNRTIDLGIVFWSPINLCPKENLGLPCPPPAGSVIPWQGSPSQLALPAPRTGGAAVQLGTHLLYIGGSDGTAATSTVYQSTVDKGNFSAWADGPALPEARTDFGVATLTGTAFVIGGTGPDGKATNTVWVLPTVGDKGDLGTWAPAQDAKKQAITLPEPRAGAAVVAVTDGILVAGGRDADGKPSKVVWKSTLDTSGALGAFVEQAALLDGVADAGSALVGEFVWIWGGTDANGPTATVQVGHYGVPGVSAPGATAGPTTIAPSPAPSGTVVALGVERWASNDAIKLPSARTGGANFTSNGTIYAVGGSDGTAPARELYWAVPDSNGNLPDKWQHLDATDLPAGGLSGGSPVVNGSAVFIIGGSTQGGLVTSALRANLAPQSPFFQLGPVGVVVPALQIPGEIGQQLGYLVAGGAAVLNFTIMVILGWMFNHKPVVRAWWNRRRGRVA
jgi:hypothetical protein